MGTDRRDDEPPRDTAQWVKGHLRGASPEQAHRICALAYDLGWSSTELWQASGGKVVGSRGDARKLLHRMRIELAEVRRAEGDRLRRDRARRACDSVEQANLEHPPYAAEVRQREWLWSSEDPVAVKWRADQRRAANDRRREKAGQRAREKSDAAEIAEKHLGTDATGKRVIDADAGALTPSRVIDSQARRVPKPSPALAMLAALSPETGITLGDALDDRGHDAPRTEPVTEAEHERRRAARAISDERVRRKLRTVGLLPDRDGDES